MIDKLEATPEELRRAHTEVIIACLRRALGPDNVDRYEDDEWRVGALLPDGQVIDVTVVERGEQP